MDEEEKRYKKLGVVKPKDLETDFDEIHDRFKKIALDEGYIGELKFVRERGKIIVYTVI